MKKVLLYILLITIVFTGALAPVHQAEAFVFLPFLAVAAGTGAIAWIFSDPILSGATSVASWILELIQTLAATLVAVAQFLLDFVIDKTIINSNLGSIEAINIGWTITRDLVNMFFIFILLYIAIATILNFGNYKKILVTLVIVALVVNFSLFATKIIIDASNVIAIGFYNEMRLGSISLSGKLAGEGLKIQKVYEVEEDDKIDKNNVTKIQYLFMSIIFLVVTAWVLLNATFLLVGRFVAFIFLMILSPLAFVSFILPGLKSKIFDKWWSTLINQAIVAPVFFFLFFIIVKIIEQDPFSYTVAEDLTGTSILFNFVVLTGLMWAALKVTRNVSGEIGASATGWGKKVGGFIAGGAVVGLARKHVVGRAARGITESAKMREFGRKNPFMGRMATAGLDKVGGAKYGKYMKEQTGKRISYGARVAKTEEEKAQYATSLTTQSKLGKITQRITNEDTINREAAKKISKGETGKEATLDDIRELLKKGGSTTDSPKSSPEKESPKIDTETSFSSAIKGKK